MSDTDDAPAGSGTDAAGGVWPSRAKVARGEKTRRRSAAVGEMEWEDPPGEMLPVTAEDDGDCCDIGGGGGAAAEDDDPPPPLRATFTPAARAFKDLATDGDSTLLATLEPPPEGAVGSSGSD